MEGQERQGGDGGDGRQLQKGDGVQVGPPEGAAQAGAGHLGADDHHGQGGVEVGQKAHRAAHHGGQPQPSEKEHQSHGQTHSARVEQGLPEGEPFPPAHEDDPVGPLGEIKGDGGHHGEDGGAGPQHRLKQGDAHKAVVGVYGAEPEHRPGILRAGAEQQGEGGTEYHIVSGGKEEHEQHVPHQGLVGLHLQGVDDDAGDDNVQQQEGQLPQCVGGEAAQLGEDKAHPHQQKEGDHLPRHHHQIM